MPRAKKTMGGMDAQPVKAISGQTYGEGVAQEGLQRTMPAPNTGSPIPPASTTTQEPTTTQASEPAPRRSLADVMSQISGTGGLLRQPDANPNVPVTEGLASGPGRGPDFRSGNNPLNRTLRRLARETGDPVFDELASRAGF